MSIRDREKEQLDAQGYLALEGFVSPTLLAALRERVEAIFAEEGERAGAEFKQEPQSRRLANLVNKGEIFQKVIAEARLLPYVRHVLGPEIKLSSLNARSADPHSTWVQPLHADMGALPDARGYWVCNTVWMLDDFTAENGTIRMLPGSHRWGKLPQEALADPMAPHPQQILLTGQAGTVVVMNAHMWHGALANRMASYQLAKELGVRQTAIDPIVAGKRAITPRIALRLARYLGTSPEFWLNLQADYDLEEEQARIAESLEKIRPRELTPL